jgi:BirA family biotin operon repressor/biotin-[acetyl-CoA-carboxylase] ligase
MCTPGASSAAALELERTRLAVRAALTGSAQALAVHVIAATASTNADLLDPAHWPETPACALLALEQSAGRGRSGRRWLSDGGTLTFSLRWPFARGAAGLLGLPLAAAVALTQALEDHAVSGLSIKWPNDLLRHGRKLGGILVEVSGSVAVVGIGLNIRLDPALAAALDQPATDLQPLQGPPLDQNALLAAVLNRLSPAMIEFEARGFAAFRAEWMQRAAWLGRSVQLGDGLEGRLLGVDDSGAVLLDTPNGIARGLAGDLSLRQRIA